MRWCGLVSPFCPFASDTPTEVKDEECYLLIPKSLHRLCWLVSFLFASWSLKAETRVANSLDLRQHSFDHAALLKGPWHFYWQQFLEPQASLPEADIVQEDLLEWNLSKGPDGKTYPINGWGTYALLLEPLPESSEPYYLLLPHAATSSRMILWDTVSRAKVLDISLGKIGTANNLPSRRFGYGSFRAEPGHSYLLILHVSNFHYGFGGQYKPPQLSQGPKALQAVVTNSVIDLVCIGIAFVVGIFNLAIWWKRREDTAALYLFLGTMTSCARILSTNVLVQTLLPDEAFFILMRLEYYPITAGSFFFLMVSYYAFWTEHFSRKILWFLGALSLGCALSSLTLPIGFTSRWLDYLQLISVLNCLSVLIVFGLAYRARIPGIRLAIFGAIIVIFSFVYDMFAVSAYRLSNIYIIAIGLSVYYIIQTALIALRVAQVYETARKLAIENEATQVALRLETEERLRLASGVAHRLNNPLNYIQTSTFLIGESVFKLQTIILALLGPENPDDPELYRCQMEIKTVFGDIKAPIDNLKNGLEKATKSVLEIRSLSGIDGFSLEYHTLAPILPGCLERLVEQQSAEECERLKYSSNLKAEDRILSNLHLLQNSLQIWLHQGLALSSGSIAITDHFVGEYYHLTMRGNFVLPGNEQYALESRMRHILRHSGCTLTLVFSGDEWSLSLISHGESGGESLSTASQDVA